MLHQFKQIEFDENMIVFLALYYFLNRMSAAVLTNQLPQDFQAIWNQRDKMHSIILIDWDSSRSNDAFHKLQGIISYVC